MVDKQGRTIDYLRISITDRCNLRCTYCMPNDISLVPKSEIMSYEEIIEVAKAASTLGINKIKITGGEPLVRKNCIPIIRGLKALPGIDAVTITTNGVLLSDYLDDLKQAKVDGINISLDTMDPDRYFKTTGKDCFYQVLDGVQKSVASGIKTKINAVSLDYEGALEDVKSLVELARNNPMDVRFIEMMPIGFGKDYPAVSHGRLLEYLVEEYPGMTLDDNSHGFGPAKYYSIPEFQGSVGLISSIHNKFCHECNRIRLTSMGELKGCLSFGQGAALLPILRSEDYGTTGQARLVEAIRQVIEEKPKGHCFETPKAVTEEKSMVSIGG